MKTVARNRPLRILFVASEAEPWMKTGGLADVASSLPRTLATLGHDVRLLIPGYADALNRDEMLTPVRAFRSPMGDAGLLQAPDTKEGLRTWLLTLPGISDRSGNPYVDGQGNEWPDNWWRFGVLSRVAAELAGGRCGLDWQADVVHCNDWQTGLTPVYCMLDRVPVATVFTIHNLQYLGLFPGAHAEDLDLPPELWTPEELEFHNQLAFIKGGLVYADELTTVSPTYADEICTPARGHGLEGLLRARRERLSGILNGIDEHCWDPARDPNLPAHYDAGDLSGKAVCKRALQEELGLASNDDAPLLAMVARLTPQKGIDLVLANLDALLERGCQLAFLGSGDAQTEAELVHAATRHHGRVAYAAGLHEALAHRIEAGADIFLMPSRFEPCGLNQLYSQRYGTPPVVHRCGGLDDNVTDALEASPGHPGTGFVFEPDTPEALRVCIDRALFWYRDAQAWQQIQRAGMARDFSWDRSARAYVELYLRALEHLTPVNKPSGSD